MRLLFLAPYVPTRIRTRPYHFVRGLAQRGHAVTLATLWQNETERLALRELETMGITVLAQPLTKARTVRNVVRAVWGRPPLQASYCWQPALAKQVQQQAGHGAFDAIHVEHLRGVRYALDLKRLAPTVWDSVDCISHLFQQARSHSLSLRGRWMTTWELGRTQQYEGWLVRQFAQITVTSAIDKTALEQLAASPTQATTSIAVLPNGVDLDYFRPPHAPRVPDTIVLSGKMSYHANITAVLHFVHDILPLIWRVRPQTRVWIVGQSPPPVVKKLASDARVQVTGTVADVRPYLTQASVAVCPLVYGAGIQNKVLEAMACATPVVSRSSGLGALQATAEVEVLVGDTPDRFAQQVLRLLADPTLAAHIGLAGRRYVERVHSWPVMLAQLEDIYQEVSRTWNWRLLR